MLKLNLASNFKEKIAENNEDMFNITFKALKRFNKYENYV